MTMASPTAASAAATAMMKNVNICPVWCRCMRLNATSVTFTAFNISSMLIRATITLRRVRNPMTPMVKRTRPRMA
jgi:hypothetical protein